MKLICRLGVILAEKKLTFGDEYNQDRFAKRVGISTSQLSALVNNKHTPKLETAFKIAEALDLTVEEIWQKKIRPLRAYSIPSCVTIRKIKFAIAKMAVCTSAVNTSSPVIAWA